MEISRRCSTLPQDPAVIFELKAILSQTHRVRLNWPGYVFLCFAAATDHWARQIDSIEVCLSSAHHPLGNELQIETFG